MRSASCIAPVALLAFLCVSSARDAAAFGGSAADLAAPGTFVVSNRANLGFTHMFRPGQGTTVDLDPELDFMVIRGLSVGGGILFHWDSGSDGGPSDVNVGVVPQVGYDLTLSPTWSFWPRLAMTLAIDNGTFQSRLEATAPFLVHPSQHFFFGAGPGVTFPLAGLPGVYTEIFGTFLVGGYFDH
jgi:hypothetical protein